MIVLFWNVRGLGNLTKHCMMTETVFEAKADKACLCETKLMTPTKCLTGALGGRRIDRWIVKVSVGASSGIMIGFNSLAYSLLHE